MEVSHHQFHVNFTALLLVALAGCSQAYEVSRPIIPHVDTPRLEDTEVATEAPMMVFKFSEDYSYGTDCAVTIQHTCRLEATKVGPGLEPAQAACTVVENLLPTCLPASFREQIASLGGASLWIAQDLNNLYHLTIRTSEGSSSLKETATLDGLDMQGEIEARSL